MRRAAIAAALAIAAAAISCGCCTVKRCSEDGREMVYVENTGWKLFDCIPIASGDPEYPNREVCLWFCDSVLLEVNTMMLDDVMRKEGFKSVRSLKSHMSDEQVIPFVFKRYSYHTSAELLR